MVRSFAGSRTRCLSLGQPWDLAKVAVKSCLALGNRLTVKVSESLVETSTGSICWINSYAVLVQTKLALDVESGNEPHFLRTTRHSTVLWLSRGALGRCPTTGLDRVVHHDIQSLPLGLLPAT